MGKIKFLEVEKFQKHLLSAYYAPGTVLGAGDIAENEIDTVSVFWELPDSGGWVGRKKIREEKAQCQGQRQSLAKRTSEVSG